VQREQGVVPAEELKCGIRGAKQLLDRPVGDEVRAKNAVARPAGHEVEQVVGGAEVPLSRYRRIKHAILDPLQLYVHQHCTLLRRERRRVPPSPPRRCRQPSPHHGSLGGRLVQLGFVKLGMK
jgi:hypothetical protein